MLCSNLTASSKAFVVEETFRQMGGQHLIVCADKEDAAYFYNDLESLLGERGIDYSKKQVLFYPTSYKRPYEPEKADNTYILSRTEVLQRVSTSERKTLIVSYPEALSEKVFTRKLLAKNTFKIKVGDKINLDFLTDMLYEYEFESVDFVWSPDSLPSVVDWSMCSPSPTTTPIVLSLISMKWKASEASISLTSFLSSS